MKTLGKLLQGKRASFANFYVLGLLQMQILLHNWQADGRYSTSCAEISNPTVCKDDFNSCVFRQSGNLPINRKRLGRPRLGL